MRLPGALGLLGPGEGHFRGDMQRHGGKRGEGHRGGQEIGHVLHAREHGQRERRDGRRAR